MAEAAESRPEGMLTLSTHDTKRSGDVRARLNLLSELPDAWGHAVRRWADRNQSRKLAGCPDTNAEYLCYQTLVGTWPIEVERVGAFMAKATKEAKVYTSWIDPNADYDEALQRFVAAVMGDPAFVAELKLACRAGKAPPDEPVLIGAVAGGEEKGVWAIEWKRGQSGSSRRWLKSAGMPSSDQGIGSRS